MSANPFDELAGLIRQLDQKLTVLEQALTKPKAEWETVPAAAVSRRKSPKTLVAAAKAGEIEYRREPRPGGRDAWLLRVADLDRHFPVRT